MQQAWVYAAGPSPRRPTTGGRRGTLAPYLREIGSVAPLTREIEAELARRIRAGDREARDRLVQGNLRFVVSVAKRYGNRGLPLEDLVAEGNLGLLRAARRFDESRGIRFITYAVWWIRQGILLALARQRRRRGVIDGSSGPASLDASLPGREDQTLLDQLADTRGPFPQERAEAEARRSGVRRALKELSSREAAVLRLSYGLDDDEERTLGEIGRRLGLSRERVRQIRERALGRLRRTREARILEGLR